MQLETDRQGLGRLARFIDPRGLNHAKAKRVMLGVAVLFLLVGIAISLDSNPEVLSNLDWRPLLVLVLVAVPVTIMLNAYEFVLIGRLVGREIGRSGTRARFAGPLGTPARIVLERLRVQPSARPTTLSRRPSSCSHIGTVSRRPSSPRFRTSLVQRRSAQI